MGEILALMIPLAALCIPIVAIISSHQQKMMQLRLAQSNQVDADVAALRAEVGELKELIHNQMITIDTLSTQQRAFGDADVAERLRMSR